ncbi:MULTISPECIES: hypothetical protein [Rhodopseudomonas]|uniref:Flagellar protein FlgN n=1 Tax=Rhodopseudomonas palustris TaxID=1076 RepID=A0A0D7F3K5_RHOPL|nr:MULTISPECIES: hypothetical protein [Rhodopseudomonas]KIZ47360.1 hypothetical protein OO17_04785 [Rhodopseudomonas palustris]MDF3811805.1 hypothetical protein [Rhodopseudomonas sp. BAL398]WOK20274.1 hypothetical protein RBJ75_12455 [Rhodopseudomonas sp. BAL398]
MTQPQHQQAPAAIVAVTTIADARKLADGLMEIMTTLLAVIERETELVRAGQIVEAIRLEPQKTDLSRRYIGAITLVKASQPYLAKATPDLLAALHRHHDVFRAMLQVNLTVLATAHAVSEGIVRGVNAEIQRKNSPQTYNSDGRRAAPGPRNIMPIAVSRSL